MGADFAPLLTLFLARPHCVPTKGLERSRPRKTGRLTNPLRYEAATDRYVEVGWDEAFDGIAKVLKSLEKKSVVFYSSGHASLEASYLYALLARLYGNNNLPQSSNMCHETTSVGLNKVIGSPVGTIVWEDLEKAGAFFFFGQNPGSNSPRFLHPLQDAKKRGARIVTFNPILEQGLISFINPQSPAEMLTGMRRRFPINIIRCRRAAISRRS